MARPKAKALDTWKKKKWYPIVAPTQFKDAVIGQTPAIEPDLMVGKTVNANMMALAGDIKKKDTEISFRIKEVKESKALTEITKFEILPSAIKRMVRRNRDRLDDSFLTRTKDDRLVRVKPFVLTLNNTKGSVKKRLRTVLRRQLVSYLSSTTYDAVLTDVLAAKLQKSLSQKLKKVYPLKTLAIRKIELAKESRRNKVLDLNSLKEEPKQEKEDLDFSEEMVAAEESGKEAPKEEAAPQEEAPAEKASEESKE